MSTSRSKITVKGFFGSVVVGAGLVAAVATPASAHVTVSSANATQGGWGTLIFKVPTESDTASTTKVQISVPQESGIASVSYQPIPGWTTQVTKVKLATPITTDDGTLTEGVGSITWTASKDAAIKPGQFQQFPVSAGPLPKTSSIAFTATQTYSDGTVVKWDQPVVEGGPEPEHPALTLELPAASEHGGSAQVASASSSTDTAAAPSSISPWSIAAFLVAVAALVVGVVAFGMARGKRS